MPRTKQPKIIPSDLIPGTQLPRPTIDLVFKTMLQNNLSALYTFNPRGNTAALLEGLVTNIPDADGPPGASALYFWPSSALYG